MTRFAVTIFFSLLIIAIIPLAAQNMPEGKVLSISGQTVIAEFLEGSLGVGDEVEIRRPKKIIDPVSGKMRGQTTETIARGLIVDFGLNKANLKITSTVGGNEVMIDDIAILTGREKKITREGPRSGSIQEISDDTIITDFGVKDEVSPGDIFLIQRNEPIIDESTKEIVGTNTVTVGRYVADNVGDSSSTARILEQNLVPQKTDIVYRESEYLDYLAVMQSDSMKIARLEDDVDILKRQLRAVQSKLDSLGVAHEMHLAEYATLTSDIEGFLNQLMKGDMKDIKIRIKNDEPYSASESKQLLTLYGQALKDCLDHELESAIRQFKAIMAQYPESKLSENCRYWIALSQFGQKDYTSAIAGFQEVLNDRRFDHKDDDAAIMLGISYYRQKRYDEAKSAFERFIAEYPKSEYRSKASFWVKQIPAG